ncbi:MAG: hypothetical protein PHV82_05530 [Victivallaceae bacterium]|nr:hypothetical protein [Victivallaceae bacterium]
MKVKSYFLFWNTVILAMTTCFSAEPGFEIKNYGRKWPGLERAALSGTRRTMCDIRTVEFMAWDKEYTLNMLKRHNSDILLIWSDKRLLNKQNLEKIHFLKKHGIKIYLGVSKIKNAYGRLPESAEYKNFFRELPLWASLADVIGMDEWFLSPAVLKTDGGQITPITEKFITAFAKWAGFSQEDAWLAFRHHKSADFRTLKAWEFCDKVQNNFAEEFVRAAKQANPEIKTWISYVTRNWNKSATCIDRAVKNFDELLQCQTYWYGRASQDSLNSSLVTAPIGMGKIFKAEYPDKFVWMGIDPGYAGGRGDTLKENSWSKKLYNNTPEELVPYLALLYAAGNGVFIQSVGGGVWLRKKNPVIDGAYADKFADMVNLVSQVVPFVKSCRRSDIAYYYEPDADWEIIRRINRFSGTSRETNEISVGLLQQFCDVDVTRNVNKYKNVVYAGLLLPAKFNYAGQNIYLMYAPEYDEKANKIPESQLFGKLNLKGFAPLEGNFRLPGGANEDGDKDTIRISETNRVTFANGKAILNPLYPTRKVSFSDKCAVIGSRNKSGNILVNSLWPSYLHQDIAGIIIKKDLNYFKWAERDCPQVNGMDKTVAAAFREPRTAVLNFSRAAALARVKIIIFNGRDGIIRNEIVKYEQGMKIKLPPLNVLVAEIIRQDNNAKRRK